MVYICYNGKVFQSLYITMEMPLIIHMLQQQGPSIYMLQWQSLLEYTCYDGKAFQSTVNVLHLAVYSI